VAAATAWSYSWRETSSFSTSAFVRSRSFPAFVSAARASSSRARAAVTRACAVPISPRAALTPAAAVVAVMGTAA
jgi:hypothetical protein